MIDRVIVDTPSPSPPKKTFPPKVNSRAADLMMNVIRKEEASRPVNPIQFKASTLR